MEQRSRGKCLFTIYLVVFYAGNLHQNVCALPIVDQGVFVLKGVSTCREGAGYCLLGLSCAIDKDFVRDDRQGHCDALTLAFTSKISFVCCKYVNDSEQESETYETTISTYTLSDDKFQILDENPQNLEDEEGENYISEDMDSSGAVDIVGIITDHTGIIDFITKPYEPTTGGTLATTAKDILTTTPTTPAMESSTGNTTPTTPAVESSTGNTTPTTTVTESSTGGTTPTRTVTTPTTAASAIALGEDGKTVSYNEIPIDLNIFRIPVKVSEVSAPSQEKETSELETKSDSAKNEEEPEEDSVLDISEGIINKNSKDPDLSSAYQNGNKLAPDENSLSPDLSSGDSAADSSASSDAGETKVEAENDSMMSFIIPTELLEPIFADTESEMTTVYNYIAQLYAEKKDDTIFEVEMEHPDITTEFMLDSDNFKLKMPPDEEEQGVGLKLPPDENEEEVEMQLQGKEEEQEVGMQLPGEEKEQDVGMQLAGEEEGQEVGLKLPPEEKEQEVEMELQGEDKGQEVGMEFIGEKKEQEAGMQLPAEEEQEVGLKLPGEEKEQEVEMELQGEDKGQEIGMQFTGEEKEKEAGMQLLAEEEQKEVGPKLPPEEKKQEVEMQLLGEEEGQEVGMQLPGEEKEQDGGTQLPAEEEGQEVGLKLTGEEKEQEVEMQLQGKEEGQEVGLMLPSEEEEQKVGLNLPPEDEGQVVGMKLQPEQKQQGIGLNLPAEESEQEIGLQLPSEDDTELKSPHKVEQNGVLKSPPHMQETLSQLPHVEEDKQVQGTDNEKLSVTQSSLLTPLKDYLKEDEAPELVGNISQTEVKNDEIGVQEEGSKLKNDETEVKIDEIKEEIFPHSIYREIIGNLPSEKIPEQSKFQSRPPNDNEKKSPNQNLFQHELHQKLKNEANYEEIFLPYPVNLNSCGIKNPYMKQDLFRRSVHPASAYEWCWSAALMKKQGAGAQDRFECSCVLIELDLVVTSAACLKRLERQDLSTYRIVLGDSNLKDELPYNIQYHDISAIISHPDYLTSEGSHANDIGLIRLKDFATLSDNVCLVCVAQQNSYVPSSSCVVSGYTRGDVPRQLRKDVESSLPPEGRLRVAPVYLEHPSECTASLIHRAPNPLLITDPNSFLCDRKHKSARCLDSFDGGSPMVCKAGDRWFLTGITSWSRDCSTEPNVYTKVSAHSDWIVSTRLRMYGFVTHKVRYIK